MSGFPIWRVVTSLGAVYEVKARTPKEFASRVQGMWSSMPWESGARVIKPDGGATFSLGYWMTPRRSY